MPWFRVDDGFWGHPKRLQMSFSAIGLWTVMGSWCMKNVTDGEVSHAALRLIGAAKRDVKTLVDCGMWEPIPGGYRFNDWDHYQKTKAQIERDREASLKRQKKARNGYRLIGADADETTEQTEDVTPSVTPLQTPPVTHAHTSPDQATPSHPYPSLNEGRVGSTRPAEFCQRHPEGTDKACSPCGRSRRAAEAWDAAQAEALAAEARAEIERRLNCPLCDDNGWTEPPNVKKCDHKGAAA